VRFAQTRARRLPACLPACLQGRPVFAFSTMSPHTADVKKDGRCSLTVMADPFRGIADGRVNLIGRMVALKDGEQATAKAAYLAKHPGSFWVEFGDFRCGAGHGGAWVVWGGRPCWGKGLMVWARVGRRRPAGWDAAAAAALRCASACLPTPLCPCPPLPLPLCSWFRLEEVVMARLVAGFARAGKVGATLRLVHLPFWG
jgi:hypothetical protein